MIIQIYAIVSIEDATALCKLGVDHIGTVVSWNGNKKRGIVSVGKAKEIIETIRKHGKISTVIVDTANLQEIMHYTEELKMDILHICHKIPLEELKKLKEFLKKLNIKLMYAIPVIDKNSISPAKEIERFADFIMLDSPFKSKQMNGFIGATGKTHDWNISAEIVKSVKKPVILGGGLSPKNVINAIKKVHPYGVDAKTSLDLPDGSGKKDIKKVELFVRKVREIET